MIQSDARRVVWTTSAPWRTRGGQALHTARSRPYSWIVLQGTRRPVRRRSLTCLTRTTLHARSQRDAPLPPGFAGEGRASAFGPTPSRFYEMADRRGRSPTRFRFRLRVRRREPTGDAAALTRRALRGARRRLRRRGLPNPTRAPGDPAPQVSPGHRLRATVGLDTPAGVRSGLLAPSLTAPSEAPTADSPSACHAVSAVAAGPHGRRRRVSRCGAPETPVCGTPSSTSRALRGAALRCGPSFRCGVVVGFGPLPPRDSGPSRGMAQLGAGTVHALAAPRDHDGRPDDDGGAQQRRHTGRLVEHDHAPAEREHDLDVADRRRAPGLDKV